MDIQLEMDRVKEETERIKKETERLVALGPVIQEKFDQIDRLDDEIRDIFKQNNLDYMSPFSPVILNEVEQQ